MPLGILPFQGEVSGISFDTCLHEVHTWDGEAEPFPSLFEPVVCRVFRLTAGTLTEGGRGDRLRSLASRQRLPWPFSGALSWPRSEKVQSGNTSPEGSRSFRTE